MAYLSWHLEDGQECIVLLRNDRRANKAGRLIPGIVRGEQLYLWGDPTRTGDMNHQLMVAGTFAANLGLDPLHKPTVHRIIDIIRSHIDDLTMMPPMPDDLRQVVAHLMITDRETGKTMHKEVRDHV